MPAAPWVNSVERTVNVPPIDWYVPPTFISAAVPGLKRSVCVRSPAASSTVLAWTATIPLPLVSIRVARSS